MAIPGEPRTPRTGAALTAPADAPPLGAEWPRQATEQIVRVVDTVRDNTTGRAITAARATVYGLVALSAAAMLGVLAVIGIVRALETALFHRVWVVYLILGVVFTVAGALCWTRRHPTRTD